MAMDYKLAAMKVLCSQLQAAKETPSQNGSMTLGGGIIFQRAWLQGILVPGQRDGLFLDDGTALCLLSLAPDFLRLQPWTPGMYVMVVGAYLPRPNNEPPMIKVHKIVDLSAFPDREAMWYLEVIEAYKLFYAPLIDEFL